MANDPVIELARRKKAGTHTREVHRIESLPKEVQELLLEMADKISAHALEIAALKTKVADLQALVKGIGQVTLDDLIRRSA